MPYATNPAVGVRIHYESVGSGPPLMLYHDISGSMEDWQDLGYMDAFKDDYQVILIGSVRTQSSGAN